jgi:mono/diheme cytochrome c family protein
MWSLVELRRDKVAHPLHAPGIAMSPMKLVSGLLVLAVAVLLSGSAAEAQNLDQGKSAPKLFSESCVTCHRSPRGLAKGRFRLTLYMFLQKHYVSGSGSAWALASYLESVDSAKRERAKGAKRPAGTTGTGQSSIRPPASVPKQ